MKKVLCVMLAVMCCGLLVGCNGNAKTDNSQNDKEAIQKEKKIATENQYGVKFNPGEYEGKEIRMKELQFNSDSNTMVLTGVVENLSQSVKEFRFSYMAYNQYGEECPFFVGSKFSQYNYRLQPAESITFTETVKNEDNSQGPYSNFTIIDIYGAEQTQETMTSNGVEAPKTLSKYDIESKSKEILSGYEVLSLDILTLTEGGYSVSVQIIQDVDGSGALQLCKDIGAKISEFNQSYEISVVSSGSQLIANYDNIGNETIY